MLLLLEHLLVPLLVHPSVILNLVKLVGQVVQLGLDIDTSRALDWGVGAGRVDGGLSAGAGGWGSRVVNNHRFSAANRALAAESSEMVAWCVRLSDRDASNWSLRDTMPVSRLQ